MNASVQAEHLSKRFGQQTALDNINGVGSRTRKCPDGDF
jgi:ABC-type multidrug transport system ATPase subunit